MNEFKEILIFVRLECAFVCWTSFCNTGLVCVVACRLFELHGQEINLKLLAKDFPPLQDAGPQTCMAFSVDGSKFATGGVVSYNLWFKQWLAPACFWLCSKRLCVQLICSMVSFIWSITGRAFKNFGVAKFAHHFGWTKSTQICQGYGF